MELSQTADFVSRYANNSGIHVTQWDFTLRFGRVASFDEQTIKIEQSVEVAMSPQHTKAFLLLLQKQVADYETKFGLIPDLSKVIESPRSA